MIEHVQCTVLENINNIADIQISQLSFSDEKSKFASVLISVGMRRPFEIGVCNLLVQIQNGPTDVDFVFVEYVIASLAALAAKTKILLVSFLIRIRPSGFVINVGWNVLPHGLFAFTIN